MQKGPVRPLQPGEPEPRGPKGDVGVVGDRGLLGERGPQLPPEEWAQIMAEVETLRPPPPPKPWVSYKVLFAIAAILAVLSLTSHYL